jgi:hypothetical protein
MTIDSLTPGNYRFKIVDAEGCENWFSEVSFVLDSRIYAAIAF